VSLRPLLSKLWTVISYEPRKNNRRAKLIRELRVFVMEKQFILIKWMEVQHCPSSLSGERVCGFDPFFNTCNDSLAFHRPACVAGAGTVAFHPP